MAGVAKVRIGHDDIYEAVGAAIEGGVLVQAVAGATNPGVQGIQAASAGSTTVLGVTARRAEPVGSQNLTGTDADGFPVAYPNPVNELTAVYKGCVVEVTYTAAAVSFGQKLQAAASGEVTAFSDASGAGDPEAIVGECRVVGGMGAGGGKGLAYIY